VVGWNIHFSIWASSVTVAVYVVLGGLFSAIFNEVLQFFLIWLGALLIPILGLVECGGWSGMVARIHQNFPGVDYIHLWKNTGTFAGNPMGVHWTGILFGMGGAIACGYWTTDFLVVQRAMAAKDLQAAKTAPLIGAYFKMAVPFIVILPGLLGLAVLPFKLVPENAVGPGMHSYNELLPLMLARYCGPGLLGLGITALIAGFMSGMAGNVTAFATVWTYDIYRPYFKKQATDEHYVKVGRWSTILGVLVSIGAAYFVTQFKSIMDYMQALVSFFISPLFAVVLMGMLWKRGTSKGGFWGLLVGSVSSVAMFTMVRMEPRKIAWVALSPNAKDMAENFYRALWSFLIAVGVTVVVSLFTKPKTASELKNLVFGYTDIPNESHMPFFRRPLFWALGVVAIFALLQWIFW